MTKDDDEPQEQQWALREYSSSFLSIFDGASFHRLGVLLIHDVAQCFEVIQCGQQCVERRLFVCSVPVSETVCSVDRIPYPRCLCSATADYS